MILGIAAGVIACNVLLLFPTIFWYVTGTNILPVPLVRHFNPDSEGNLFTWYSSLLLILASMSALVNFGLDSLGADAGTQKRYAWLWFCVVMLFLSLDEVASIHEGIGRIVKHKLMESGQWSGLVQDTGKRWILVYAPAILAVVASMLVMFTRLWRRRRGIAVCALIGMSLWIGSLGLEFTLKDLCEGAVDTTRCEQAEILLEEACEIFGTSGLLIAFVWYAHDRVNQLVDVSRLCRSPGD